MRNVISNSNNFNNHYGNNYPWWLFFKKLVDILFFRAIIDIVKAVRDKVK